MWDPVEVSPASIVIGMSWVTAPALIFAAWITDINELGQLGIVVSAAAATLTVLRDNQRTRRMLKRPGETLASLSRTRQGGGD